MTESLPVNIQVGCVNPVGGCWDQCVGSIRGAILRRELVPVGDQQLVWARVADEHLQSQIDATQLENRAARCTALAQLALQDLAQRSEIPEGTPAYMATGEPLEDVEQLEPGRLFADLNANDGLPSLDVKKVFPYGPAGGIAALNAGLKHLDASPDTHSVLVGGVDSLATKACLKAIAGQGRALVLGAPEGVVPGEGAAFLKLSRATKDSGAFAFGGPFFGQASGSRTQDKSTWPDTLSELLVKAVQTPSRPVATVMGTYAGSAVSSNEWAIGSMSCIQKLAEGYAWEVPGLNFGDLGAAFLPTLLGLSVHEAVGRHSAGACLLWAVSEDGKMGATVLESIPRQKQGT